jgi:hypothetical protein
MMNVHRTDPPLDGDRRTQVFVSSAVIEGTQATA